MDKVEISIFKRKNLLLSRHFLFAVCYLIKLEMSGLKKELTNIKRKTRHVRFLKKQKLLVTKKKISSLKYKFPI